MTNRNCWIWIAFAFCACLVVGAMMWLTRSVIHTEEERAHAEIRAEIQERVRLALWRMDSLGASMLVEENAIPRELFLTEVKTSLPVIARFETPDGAAIRGTGNPQSLDRCSAQLPGLMNTPIISPQQEQPPADDKKPDETAAINQTQEANANDTYLTENGNAYGLNRKDSKAQASANKVEWMTRERMLDKSFNPQNYQSLLENQKFLENQTKGSADQNARNTIPSQNEIANPVGDFKTTWHEQSLFLIRRGMTLTSFAQGALVDAAVLRELLLAEAKPMLPQATLVPSGNGGDDSYNLASFPFQLQPGTLGETPDSIPQTISISLLVGWLAAMVALLTAFALITNVMKLSERRASFVSAVTHELRTPLTTFRLYSDMLSSGAVREEKQASYLKVLSREADRLSHLVENVLAFSKIERGSARSTVSEVALDELLESFRERFAARLEAAGLTLEIMPIEPIRTTIDTSALEHILFNLIDNAAKYAVSSDPPVVSLTAHARKGRIEICVADHGPGISTDECRRIFRPFHKSAKQAAESQPGVGLGLSLSRRLARSMGGTLDCRARNHGAHGAEFILSLPRG